MQLPDLEKFVQFVNAIPAANNALGEMVQTKTGLVIFLLIILWSLKALGAARFIRWFDQRSRVKNVALASYLDKVDGKDPICLAAVRERIDSDNFQLATGLRAGRLHRRALSELHAKIEHRLGWRGIRHASQYFKFYADGTMSIKRRNLFDTLGYRFAQFMTYFFIAGAVLLVSIMLLTDDAGLRIVIAIAGLPAAVLLIGFSFYLTMPEYCAQRILDTLAEQGSLEGD